MSLKKDPHSHESHYREKVVEHVFVGTLLQYLWTKKMTKVDVLKPEIDNGGYDFVITLGKTVRHIQLKASRLEGKTASQNINLNLGQHPSGCVIWILVDEELAFKKFLWFGGKPNEELPDLSCYKTDKHSRANAEGVKAQRVNTKTIPKSAFESVHTFPALVKKLFGDNS
jgi:hypothetical protein